MNFFSSPLLAAIPRLQHGFGTQLCPVPLREEIQWEKNRPRWKQVHGTKCAHVSSLGADLGDVDLLWTTEINIPIGILTADCVPILLARKDASAIAAIHAGWRGTLAKAVENFGIEIKATGQNPADWVAALGPAIRSCCYEVSEALIEDFKSGFPALSPSLIEPTNKHLDLISINQAELKRIGISEIDVTSPCTCCTKQGETTPFHSFRRDQADSGRQVSVIYLD